MRGQNHLLRLRSGAYVDGQRQILGDSHIAHVCVSVCDEAPQYGHFTDPENGYTGSFPELDILPEDVIGALDLRCLHGLRVMVNGTNEARMREFCARAKQFDPAELLVCLPSCTVIWRAGIYEKITLEQAA